MASEPEAFYHGIFLGLLATLEETYLIESNRESGEGRPDILLTPKDTTKPAVILEFKKAKSKETLEASSKFARDQIIERHYSEQLKMHGITSVHRVGIGFLGKENAVTLDTESLRSENSISFRMT